MKILKVLLIFVDNIRSKLVLIPFFCESMSFCGGKKNPVEHLI